MGTDGYVQQHIVRKILMLTVSEDLLGKLSMAELRGYLPDEKDLLAKIPETWTGEQVTNVFSNSPLMVACWACLASQIPEAGSTRRVFERASPRELRRIQHRLLLKHGGVAPNLVTLAEELEMSGAGLKELMLGSTPPSEAKRQPAPGAGGRDRPQSGPGDTRGQ